jgi:hypothetical protein
MFQMDIYRETIIFIDEFIVLTNFHNMSTLTDPYIDLRLIDSHVPSLNYLYLNLHILLEII